MGMDIKLVFDWRRIGPYLLDQEAHKQLLACQLEEILDSYPEPTEYRQNLIQKIKQVDDRNNKPTY